MTIILIVFLIIHKENQPFLTNNMNKSSELCDFSLLLIILIKTYSYSDSKMNNQNIIEIIMFFIVMSIKIFVFLKILRWNFSILLLNKKKIILSKFKKIGIFIFSYIDGNYFNIISF